MPITDLFSKRQKRQRGEVPDVYVYDSLPGPLRVQILHVLHGVIGDREATGGYISEHTISHHAHAEMVKILRKERGVFVLPPATRADEDDYIREFANYFLAEKDSEKALDCVELTCLAIQGYGQRTSRDPNAVSEAILEINQRLKEHGVGYEFDEEIIRIDSEMVHAEAVKPALTLLRDQAYSGAEQEFRSAFDHYRSGKTKEALTDALKSLESVMKVICTKQKWAFKQTDTAKTLIEVCLSNGLIPTYWQTHFASLRSMLESSVPTARNKEGGHGQGVEIRTVPDYLASYVLHMTASTIVFLVEAEKALL